MVCCCPEEIKQKIICKAGDSIESITIKVPEEPKTDDKKGKKKKTDDKKGDDPKTGQEEKKKPDKVPVPVPVPPYVIGYPPPCYGRPGPFRTCCKECYEGHPGGPCLYGQGGPPPPPPRPPCIQYDGYWGRPVCESYGGERGCYLIHYNERASPGSCLIM